MAIINSFQLVSEEPEEAPVAQNPPIQAPTVQDPSAPVPLDPKLVTPPPRSARFNNFEYNYDIPVLGTITIGCSRLGLRYLRPVKDRYKRNRIESLLLLRKAAAALRAYLKGEPYPFADLTLDLRGTELQCAVWKHLLTIPYGEIRTVAQFAKEMGREGNAATPIASCVAANPLPIIIPCHRVIRNSGSWRESRLGDGITRFLLTLEGHDLPA